MKYKLILEKLPTEQRAYLYEKRFLFWHNLQGKRWVTGYEDGLNKYIESCKNLYGDKLTIKDNRK